jgi:hypothetical protein
MTPDNACHMNIYIRLCVHLQPNSAYNNHREVKVKVKFTLEQVMKAQRGSKGIALLFL